MAPFQRSNLPAHLKHPHAGRPTEYRPEYCGLVIDQARMHGTSVAAFAGVIGVSKQSVYEWIERHSEFSDACARAKAARLLWWELKLGRSRKGAETQASMFALRNAEPDEWRDVRSVQHDHTLTADRLTTAELHALIRQRTGKDSTVIDGEFWHSETGKTR